MYSELADVYETAATTLGCKELRLFLTAQASRLRMMTLEAVTPQAEAYLSATQHLLATISGMTQRRRVGRVVNLH